MKFSVPSQKQDNIALFLRVTGYKQEANRRTGQVSYVRLLSNRDFPRFHIYVEEGDGVWHINLHLDQKAPSYSGTSAHAGEYDGELVETEMERIKKSVVV